MCSAIEYETVSLVCRTGLCKRKLVLLLSFLALDTRFPLERARSQIFGLKPYSKYDQSLHNSAQTEPAVAGNPVANLHFRGTAKRT